ncbi:disease resistance protein RPM1 [Arachis ipaensis]|uniref:disease resistance protein RPM1 n=1 Tax=Arachis ipaensis TaxID=130454 RepID=UPI0007AF944C|nr:disease resistance protein RPM1 [Arachis ipaensis]
MAEIAVSFVLDQLFPLLRDKARTLQGAHKEFEDVKDELESICAFLKDADTRAAKDNNALDDDGIKSWVRQLREAAFQIEDLVDEYLIYQQQWPSHSGVAASLCKAASLIKNLKRRHRLASDAQDIKSRVRGIKERSERYGFHCSSRESHSAKSHDTRMASLFMEEAEVVGVEATRDELVGWLVEGTTDRTVISVVGMGGLGKTTLAKKVYDDTNVTANFECRAWITVSQSYTIEGLLRNMLDQFYKERREAPVPAAVDLSRMDQESLIEEVRSYLQQKRYVVVFDDIWNVNFWGQIEFAVYDNKKGSRVMITTRSMNVAEFCRRSSFVNIHNLRPLSQEKSWELFCKKAFRFDLDGRCPEELADISFEIVKKCKGLPLAIVAIGGLLSTKEKNAIQWRKLSENLSLEFEKNPHLSGITKILALSYDDLPYNLKACFLYFGLYPEDYLVNSERLIWQWIAEGFVKHQKGKTLEQVAEQYLTELIHRSLVQASIEVDGKVESCQVHDLFRDLIVRNMEDLSFARFVTKEDQSPIVGITRRLAIANSPDDFIRSLSSSTRSLHVFRVEELSETFVKSIVKKCRLLRVLNFRDAPLGQVPENLGKLLHLRYLSLRNTDIRTLPKSIGKLQNLETLDLRQTRVREIPKEINKLKKLRHLIAYHLNFKVDFRMSWDWEKGVQMNGAVGSLTSLQTLCLVKANHGGVELLSELGKLKHLRSLALSHMKREYGSVLHVSIREMHHLETLEITAIDENEVIDFPLVSSVPQLQHLRLRGKLEKLPDGIQQLWYLVRLSLSYSMLGDDPLKALQDMPNLMHLLMYDAAYEGKSLHFREKRFLKLKELTLKNLFGLNSILIDKGSLPNLKRVNLENIPQMKKVPFGIRHLVSLEDLYFVDMQNELVESIDPIGGQQHWIIEHVPIVYVRHKVGPKFAVFDTRVIRHSRRS